jgi:hypothetical protein
MPRLSEPTAAQLQQKRTQRTGKICRVGESDAQGHVTAGGDLVAIGRAPLEARTVGLPADAITERSRLLRPAGPFPAELPPPQPTI